MSAPKLIQNRKSSDIKAYRKLIKVLQQYGSQSLIPILTLFMFAGVFNSGAISPEFASILPWLQSIGFGAFSLLLDRATDKSTTDSELLDEIKRHINAIKIEQEITDRTLQKNIARLIEREARTFEIIIEKLDASTRNIIVQQLNQYNDLKVDIYTGLLTVRTDIHDLSMELKKGISEVETQLYGTEQRIQDSIAGLHINQRSLPYLVSLADQKIQNAVDKLRKSRFYPEADLVQSVGTLIESLENGKLSGATSDVKSRALAWCIRLLIPTENTEKLATYLTQASKWGASPEVQIARAFLIAKQGDNNYALGILDDLNTPAARSAALMIKINHSGVEEAIMWMKNAGINAKEIDSEGKFILLSNLLYINQWKAAHEILESLTDEDLNETPVLYGIVAKIHLLDAVDEELRNLVLSQLPLQMRGFPLASDVNGINAREVAYDHFILAARRAEQLGCLQAADIFEEYAIWLQLENPKTFNEGIQNLKIKLQDEKLALRYVQLGLEYGIPIVRELVERRIEQQIALRGEITLDGARARLALAHTSKTPSDFAAYLSRHHNELYRFFDKKYLFVLQIEMLLEAGNRSQAWELYKLLQEEGISETESNRFRQMFSDAGANEERSHSFRQTNSLVDLIALVGELEHVHDWEQLCIYGEILYKRTTALRDGERLAQALYSTHKYQKLVEFLRTNEALLRQSFSLQMSYCWGLYFEGSLVDAQAELAKLKGFEDDENYRILQINLSISIGDWERITAFAANELKNKQKRSAIDLIKTAQLVTTLSPNTTKELLYSAVAKGSEDPQILFSSYILASQIGLENEEEISGWIQHASTLSGEDGPVQRMSLEDIFNKKPEWDRQVSETWELLMRSNTPLFMAANSLNKHLIDLQLFPALANLSETDPRRRSVIPVYSGNRSQPALKIGGVLGLGATALLSLSYLNLLEKAIESFDTIYIPHSTMWWLFVERQNARFHQPSRIKDAHKLSSMIINDLAERFSPHTVPNSDLANQVGDELAALLTEARDRSSSSQDIQHLVVRSAPVHRLGSLLSEEADLSDLSLVLISCGTVINKLRKMGKITLKEVNKSHAYLRFQEKPWANEPEIEEGAVLFLDSLSIFHFLHLGVLEKLAPAGFVPVISDQAMVEAKSLIAYESLFDNILQALEKIRTVINLGIGNGKIKVGRRQYFNDSENLLIDEHPTREVFSLVECCDAVIEDDRFLNQHGFVKNNALQVPIYTTLDLLKVLLSADLITSEEMWEHKTMLRRGGYLFIPLDIDELAFHLEASEVQNGKVIETAELRAIREYILKVRMCGWLQIPQEKLWLDTIFNTLIQVLRQQWRTDAEIEILVAHSNWILELLDVRGWAYLLSYEEADNLIRIGRGMSILHLVVPLDNVSEEVNNAYWNWVEEHIIEPIKESSPELFFWIIERAKHAIEMVIDKSLDDLEDL